MPKAVSTSTTPAAPPPTSHVTAWSYADIAAVAGSYAEWRQEAFDDHELLMIAASLSEQSDRQMARGPAIVGRDAVVKYMKRFAARQARHLQIASIFGATHERYARVIGDISGSTGDAA